MVWNDMLPLNLCMGQNLLEDKSVTLNFKILRDKYADFSHFII